MKKLIEEIFEKLAARGATFASAESCTGGLIASTTTDIPGASAFFRGGIVAYSAEVKISLLGVPAETILRHGVVSCECAEAMARGCAEKLGAQFAVATTGVAGPGAQDGVPAGTVCIALQTPQGTRAGKFFFPGEPRDRVKILAVRAALQMLADGI